MKIIFNSDLLFAKSLIRDELPRQVKEFLAVCKKAGHEIVIPLTTLLEFNNKQDKFVNDERASLINARSKLTSLGISVDTFDESDLVTRPDLIQLMVNCGVSCSLEVPTLSDYESAHRRACLKESPLPPDMKSDEMRDLIIWEIALRVSAAYGGAILMSRDGVHMHHRGDKEASINRLIRRESFEQAYEALSIETFSAKVVKRVLENAWDDILVSRLPLEDGAQVISITNARFIETDSGTSKATARVGFITGHGKTLACQLATEYADDQPFVLEFRDIEIDGEPIVEGVELDFEKPMALKHDLGDRLANLNEILRSEQ